MAKTGRGDRGVVLEPHPIGPPLDDSLEAERGSELFHLVSFSGSACGREPDVMT